MYTFSMVLWWDGHDAMIHPRTHASPMYNLDYLLFLTTVAAGPDLAGQRTFAACNALHVVLMKIT